MTWTIGDTRIVPVVETVLSLDGRGLLPELAEAPSEVRSGWGFQTSGEIELAFQAFVVLTADRTLLVDACLGDRPSPFAEIAAPGSRFLEALSDAGVAPENIDTVVCTHLHFDHTGWLTRRAGDRWVPTFPNADHLLVGEEWHHWAEHPSPIVLLEDSVAVIVDEARHRVVSTEHEIAAGVRLVSTPGHTPGHVSVEVRADGEAAVITGDAFHHPVQVRHPEWRDVSDTDHDQAVATRQALLERCARTGTWMIGSHFSEPTAGRVVRVGDGFELVPIDPGLR